MNDSSGQVPLDAPQPASVLPDSFQQPGVQQKAQKRRRMWWIIAAGALLLVLIVGGPGFFVVLPTTQKSSLERTLQTYCDAYKHIDDKELESTFSAHFKTVKENASEGAYLYIFLQTRLGASFTSCTVSDIQQHGSTATATVTILLQGGITDQGFQDPGMVSISTQRISLILENGLWTWKVNDVQAG